jgi:hypothetical protein
MSRKQRFLEGLQPSKPGCVSDRELMFAKGNAGAQYFVHTHADQPAMM